MSVADDARTLGRTRLTFANAAEIDEFVDVLGRFERGEISPEAWRRFRLVRGTYGQRQADDAQMLRVKIPEGILGGEQLHALADIADRYSRGFGHVTTRQNVQFHFVKMHDVDMAMRRAADAGLTTREACGNSVRNITACPFAGVAHDEAFDVTPYAEALTRYLLRHPLSASLPRKFKIGFEGCARDHALTPIHDIGFRAVLREGPLGPERGFRVTVGGGTAILCTSGVLLHDFAPAGELFEIAEAIVRVFHRHGDYEHKHRNRMKFLIRALGWDGWREAFERELAGFREEGGARLPFEPEDPPVEAAPDWPRPAPPVPDAIAALVAQTPVRGPGLVPEATPIRPSRHDFDRWTATNVRPQKQDGYHVATITLPLGDITGAQFRVVAALASAHGDGSVRTSVEQNLVLRWVPAADLPALYAGLCAAGLGRAGAATVEDVTSCPGAESCRLAVTQSRGLAAVLGQQLRDRPELASRAASLDVKISGCPNGCGQHHVAALGFQGSVRKVAGRAVPQYFVLAGGGVDEAGASFGRVVAKIPARRCAEAVTRIIDLYDAERAAGETPASFLRRTEPARLKTLLADLEHLTPETLQPQDLVDLGEDHAFVPDVQDGECSA